MTTVVVRPHISEKAIGLAESGTYVFDVPTSSNKIEVAKAVEKSFKVKVATVNMMITKGKSVSLRRKGGKSTTGRRSNVKKAMVRLMPGQKINLFDEKAK
jgi:large subunit ribosomal protein L23